LSTLCATRSSTSSGFPRPSPADCSTGASLAVACPILWWWLTARAASFCRPPVSFPISRCF
jgi:hypothetical protein